MASHRGAGFMPAALALEDDPVARQTGARRPVRTNTATQVTPDLGQVPLSQVRVQGVASYCLGLCTALADPAGPPWAAAAMAVLQAAHGGAALPAACFRCLQWSS